jgi:hypothetical protein
VPTSGVRFALLASAARQRLSARDDACACDAKLQARGHRDFPMLDEKHYTARR